MFITIEGGEGTGKSTLTKSLCKYLVEEKGFFVMNTFEPGATSLGKEIRQILLHKKEMVISKRAELLLFLADRAHHVEVVIKPALRENIVVICDRFTDSSIAYQGAARGVTNLENVCLFATDNLIPDLTFFLDVDPKIGLARIKGEKDRLEQEVIEFHERVRMSYLELARKHKERIYTLDASQSPEKVFEDAIKILDTEWLTLL